MGTRGPVPERTDQRRRRNKDATPTTEVPRVSAATVGPELGLELHELARDWYNGLRESAQAQYYEPSDWQVARIVAQGIHDYMTDRNRSAMKFTAVLSAMSSLLVTEGDRRRVRMEIERGKPDDSAERAKVLRLSEYQKYAG